MTLEELNRFLEDHPDVEWARDDDGTLYLRHSVFDGEHEKVRIEPGALEAITPARLEQILVGGRNVEHITRITGYFSRVSGWNKGKKAELSDRERVKVA